MQVVESAIIEILTKSSIVLIIDDLHIFEEVFVAVLLDVLSLQLQVLILHRLWG